MRTADARPPYDCGPHAGSKYATAPSCGMLNPIVVMIACESCGGSLRISEELFDRRVRGRVVTVKCRQCNADIRVDGTVDHERSSPTHPRPPRPPVRDPLAETVRIPAPPRGSDPDSSLAKTVRILAPPKGSDLEPSLGETVRLPAPPRGSDLEPSLAETVRTPAPPRSMDEPTLAVPLSFYLEAAGQAGMAAEDPDDPTDEDRPTPVVPYVAVPDESRPTPTTGRRPFIPAGKNPSEPLTGNPPAGNPPAGNLNANPRPEESPVGALVASTTVDPTPGFSRQEVGTSSDLAVDLPGQEATSSVPPNPAAASSSRRILVAALALTAGLAVIGVATATVFLAGGEAPATAEQSEPDPGQLARTENAMLAQGVGGPPTQEAALRAPSSTPATQTTPADEPSELARDHASSSSTDPSEVSLEESVGDLDESEILAVDAGDPDEGRDEEALDDADDAEEEAASSEEEEVDESGSDEIAEEKKPTRDAARSKPAVRKKASAAHQQEVDRKPRILASSVGHGRVRSKPDARLPPGLKGSQATFSATVQICVSESGRVSDVRIIKSAGPAVDSRIVSALRRWRYKPLREDGTAVPFCYAMKYEIGG